MRELMGKLKKINKPLLSPRDLEEMGLQSAQQLRLDRSLKRGMPFIRVNSRVIRYRTADVAKFLQGALVIPRGKKSN